MTLTKQVLEAALAGFEAQIEEIKEAIAELDAKAAPANGKKRRPMSAAARKRIAVAQRRRWREARKAALVE